ncbi:MAG TPA: Lrp/AsnC family transcriptional regulator [Nitrososphaeraceae archaeon]
MTKSKSIRIESLQRISANNNDVYDNAAPKYVSKLLDSIDIKIISELVRQPDISSLSLSKKIDIPLSTLQRRRARIEKAILKRDYTFNYKAFGGRVGDLIIAVDKGKSKEIAQSLLKKYKNNIVSCDTRINSEHNISAHIIYKNTEELYDLIESIKTMEYVDGVHWSEMVEIMGDNNSEVISAFFNK